MHHARVYTFLDRSLLRATTNDVVHLGNWTGLQSSIPTAYIQNVLNKQVRTAESEPYANMLMSDLVSTCQRLLIILRHTLLTGSPWDILHCYVL
jgi:hypothetical protein